MSAPRSSGLLVYRVGSGEVEVLLAHPGGPFWQKRDEGAWSVVKGEIADGEDPLSAARREFEEETGLTPPSGPATPLGSITQKAGKVVEVWAVEGVVDPDSVVPGTFRMEWPPRSGRFADFPEVDRVAWFDPNSARNKLNPAQVELLDRLLMHLGYGK
ncbi:MAG TPA: NUDIX domain-containing protein [Acidimicrobiia bacterium]|jgi:predicted NUDIX family NTP pyrophosphohydrolase|nr:NUDIX domain-containing protein [Acidimicrobiia bacterium]